MSSINQSKVDNEGYYFSPDRAEICQAHEGEHLPEARNWEYIGSAEDMTPADAVAVVEERYPDISIELTFRPIPGVNHGTTT